MDDAECKSYITDRAIAKRPASASVILSRLKIAVNQRNFAKAKEDLMVSDRLAHGNADTREKLEKVKRFEKTWPGVEAIVPVFDKCVEEKKPFSAQKVLLEIQNLQADMPGGMANPTSRRISEDFNRAFKEYNTYMLAWEQRHTRYFNEKNWQAMLDNALDAQKRELSPARQKDVQSAFDFARQQMAGKQNGDVTAAPATGTQSTSGAQTTEQPGRAAATEGKTGTAILADKKMPHRIFFHL